MKYIAQLVLDVLSFFLKQSKSAIYYLVKHSLKDEIKEASKTAFAHQHIENAIQIAKNAPNTEGVILDVGGGTASTATIFHASFPNNRIYVFEPIKANFETIKIQTKPNWQLINKAVGSEITTSFINVSSYITASSLLELNPHTDGYDDYLQLKEKERIDVTTLDSEVKQGTPILILKMDVQGFELEVLKGATKTLENTHVIVIEINNHDGYKGSPSYFDIDEYLRAKNFELFDMLCSNRIKNKLQDWDAIYVNKNLPKK
jgi:FkbM family methyltransferase